MKNLSIVLFIILVFASSAFAMLVFVPLDEAIRDSDLIIIGTLTDIAERHKEGSTIGEGKIVVKQFIAGNVKTENGILLKSADKLQLNYAETFACVMGSHKGIENEKGVFLIKLDDAGEIQYKDFRSIEDLAEIKKLLKKGIRPSKLAKIIKIHNQTEQISQPILIEQSSETTFRALNSSDSKEKEYSPFQALLVILASISLYYFLYRSRFKIR
ncbi:MAG: hypothetical protein ACR2F2_08360 [Pyrinomonadaceae bacterium]